MSSAAVDDLPAEADCAIGGLLVDHMGEPFPAAAYSRKDVVRAGDVLSEKIPWDPEKTDAVNQTVRIAYAWRNSHILPMRRVRYELGGKLRRLKIPAITAARTKRMKSIRKKLARTSNTLIQIQDLGGSRAILDSIEDVQALVSVYRNGGSMHRVRNDKSYIDEPRIGGYRSHHFVLSFLGDEREAEYDGRRIEVQIRTRLQHA